MAKGVASGKKVSTKDIPIIMGMIGRGDRHHDIAAWFGLNQGRIKDTQDGKYGPPTTTAGTTLPPKGPPGVKGRFLRDEVTSAIAKLKSNDLAGALKDLQAGLTAYNANDP